MDCSSCSRAKVVSEEISLLENALGFIDDELQHELSMALIGVLSFNRPTISELEEFLGPDTYEVVLFGFTWRLIFPHAVGYESMAWEDTTMSLERSAGLKIPLVVELLIREAAKSGFWTPVKALMQSSPLLPEDAKVLAKLGNNIVQYSPGGVISANELKASLFEAKIDCNLDALIAHWKGAGVISPRLSSFKSVANHRSPVYEINPSVFIPGFVE